MARRSPATGACSASSTNADSSALALIVVDLLVVGDDLLGQHQIGLQQGLRGAFHGNARQPAHLAELVCQGIQLLVVRGSHVPSLRGTSAKGHDSHGERKVNDACLKRGYS